MEICFSWNIRNLPSGFGELDATLDILGHPQIVGFLETWLFPVNKFFDSLLVYNIIHQSRTTKMGGGAAILGPRWSPRRGSRPQHWRCLTDDE